MVPILRYCRPRDFRCISNYQKSNDSNKSIAESILNSTIKDNSSFIDEKDIKKICSEVSKEYPEEPTTCCMSGCANCVWIEYADKISEYFRDGGEKAMEEIEKRVTDSNIKAFLMHELRMRKKSGDNK